MPMHAKVCRHVGSVLCLIVGMAQAQTPASRSLADEMDSNNTATGRMLALVKASKAQEQAAKGFGPIPLPQTINPAGNTNPGTAGVAVKQAASPPPPEEPTLWYLAGVGDRLVAELIFQQRVYKLSADSEPQSVGPWTLLSIDSHGVQLSLNSGKRLTLRAPLPGQAPPKLNTLQAFSGTTTQTIVPPLVPRLSPVPNIFSLPK